VRLAVDDDRLRREGRHLFRVEGVGRAARVKVGWI
jgi:hypothetical protein